MPLTIERLFDSSTTTGTARWVRTVGAVRLDTTNAAASWPLQGEAAQGSPVGEVPRAGPTGVHPLQREQRLSPAVQVAMERLDEGRARARRAMAEAVDGARRTLRSATAFGSLARFYGWSAQEIRDYRAGRLALGKFTAALHRDADPSASVLVPAGASSPVRDAISLVYRSRRSDTNLYSRSNVYSSSCNCCGSLFLGILRRGESQSAVCPACSAAGVISTPDGRYFRSEADALANGYARFRVLDDRGEEKEALVHAASSSFSHSRDGRKVTLPGVENGWVERAMLGYHSGEGRDRLNPTAAVTTGTEIEWNAGGRANGGHMSRAANIRWLQRKGLTVERDGSVTGFEMITGHGLPRDVREVLHPVYKLREHTLTGLRTGSQTGQHVHVTFDRDDATAVRRLREAFTEEEGTSRLAIRQPAVQLYMAAAGRMPNTYCPLTISTGHRTAIGIRDDTLEFRLFRNPGRLPMTIRNVQLSWAMVRFIQVADAGFSYDAFASFVSDLPMDDTLELRAWLNSHRALTSAQELTVDAKLARQYYGRASLV